MLIGDSDGKARTARRHIVGADKISRFLFGLVELYGVDRISFGELVLVNGELGMRIPDHARGRRALGDHPAGDDVRGRATAG